ncbi:MAG: hypothetical protein ACLUIR_01545 [Faecalibacterium prausnitzii]
MKQNKAEKLLRVCFPSLGHGRQRHARLCGTRPYADMDSVSHQNYELANRDLSRRRRSLTSTDVTDASDASPQNMPTSARDYLRAKPAATKTRRSNRLPSTTAWASTPTSSMRWRATAQA